jgi:hypothetical protein
MPATSEVPVSRIATLAALVLLLAGCLGSPNPYRPGYQERPVETPPETAEQEARRLAVPMEIVREDTYLKVGKKEIARIQGDIPRNVFTGWEDDLDETLGVDERTGEAVAEAYLNRPDYYLDLRKKVKVARAKQDAEDAGEEVDEDAGDEDEDEDDYDDDDWDD